MFDSGSFQKISDGGTIFPGDPIQYSVTCPGKKDYIIILMYTILAELITMFLVGKDAGGDSMD